MKPVPLRVRSPFEYGGRTYQVGAYVEIASWFDAAALVTAGRASLTARQAAPAIEPSTDAEPPHLYGRSPLASPPRRRSASRKDLTAESPDAPPKPKRTYKRRDLTPEA